MTGALGLGATVGVPSVSAQTTGGDLVWKFETGDDVWSSPTVVGGTVFIGSRDHNVYALDASSGDERWAFETGDWVGSSPTVADGTVFVGSGDGKVYALDASSGDERWTFETGEWIGSSPTVADGTVFVGSHDNNVYALDAGVAGSSRGSRVLSRTLGHHDITHDEGTDGEDEPGDETDEEDGNVDSPSTDEDDPDPLPGFGVGGTLAGLGAGYLLERRISGDDE